MHVHIAAIQKWRARKTTHTSAFRTTLKHLETFIYEETSLYKHAWKIAQPQEETQFECEIMFLTEAIVQQEKYDMTDLVKLTERLVGKAKNNGKQRARELHEAKIAEALMNGAGSAH